MTADTMKTRRSFLSALGAALICANGWLGFREAMNPIIGEVFVLNREFSDSEIALLHNGKLVSITRFRTVLNIRDAGEEFFMDGSILETDNDAHFMAWSPEADW